MTLKNNIAETKITENGNIYIFCECDYTNPKQDIMF